MANIYGSDSGSNGASQNSCVSGAQFYVGKLGENVTISDGGHFNYTLATQLLKTPGNKVYGYWYLHGAADPAASNYPSMYAYGQAQGNLAIQAKNQQSAYINGLSIFADIETLNSNWSSSNVQGNRDIINGFFSTSIYVGPYSAPCAWQQITGSVDWMPTLPSNWAGSAWTSQYNYGSQDPGCIDGNWSNWIYNAACGTQQKVAQGFGNFTPVFWQYAIDVSGRDLDIAWTLPS